MFNFDRQGMQSEAIHLRATVRTKILEAISFRALRNSKVVAAQFKLV